MEYVAPFRTTEHAMAGAAPSDSAPNLIGRLRRRLTRDAKSCTGAHATNTEIATGRLKAIDPRPVREKIQDNKPTVGRYLDRDRSRNVFRDEQRRLEDMLAHAMRPQDKAQIQRRLVQTIACAEKFDREQAATQEREAFNESISDLVALGKIGSTSYKPVVTQPIKHSSTHTARAWRS